MWGTICPAHLGTYLTSPAQLGNCLPSSELATSKTLEAVTTPSSVELTPPPGDVFFGGCRDEGRLHGSNWLSQLDDQRLIKDSYYIYIYMYIYIYVINI